MTHGSEWDMEIGLPSIEDVTLGLRPRVTCSTSGCHISMSHSLLLNVTLTTLHHLYNVLQVSFLRK